MLNQRSYQHSAVSNQQNTKRGIFKSFIFLLFLLLIPISAHADTETITYDYYNSRAVKSAIYSTATSQTMVAYSYDNSGNITGRTVDASPPDTTITSNPSNPSNSSTADFSFTSTVTTFECKLDSGTYSTCTSPKQYTNLTDGMHTFSVRAVNANGFPDPTPAEYEWKIDTIPPSSVITYPYGSFIIGNTVTITGTASDIGSNVSKVEIKINSGAWTEATGTTSWTYIWTIPSDDSYTIQFRATDSAGNIETATAGITIDAYHRTPSTVTIDENNQLLINTSQFTIKGVNYSPTPIGDDPTTAPYGDYFTFTTYNAGIYNRDLPLLRDMGANTVRLWTWDNTADHHDFLDNAYNNGTNPVYVIAGFHINPGLDIDPASQDNVREQIIADFREMVANYKNHPAILMWAIGNDLNSSSMYGSDLANLFSLIDEMAYEAYLEDASHPVMVPLADEDLINTITTYDTTMPYVNILGANIYRGDSFGTLFSDYSEASAKPLLITEFGIDAYNDTNIMEDQTTQADYAYDLWSEIQQNSATAIGGVYKEYSDEWWMDALSVDVGCPEADNPETHGDCGTTASSFPDSYDNFEWWGIMSITEDAGNPDIVSARAVYNALQSLWRADFDLTISKTGTGSGTVTSSPAGIDCGADCSASFDNGTPVAFTATPDEGSTFAGWSGDAGCIYGQVTMNVDKNCTATFNLLPAVATLDAWTNIYSSSPNNTSATGLNVGSFTVSSGTQRLMLVAVVMRLDSNRVPTINATYGGEALTQIDIIPGDTNKEVVWMGYLKDADIGSGLKTLTITYDLGSGNAVGLHVKRASYTGVNQTSPFAGYEGEYKRSNSVPFSSTINYVNDGITVVVTGNNGTSATAALTTTPAFTELTDAKTTTDNHTSTVFTTTQHDSNGSYASSTEVSWSNGGGHSGLVAVSLQPATVNQPPVFSPSTFSRADAVVDVAYTGQTIAGSATDPDSDPITYEKVSGDDWLTVGTDGTLSGNPTATGNYSFGVSATATGGVAYATLNISVVTAPVNQPPVFNPSTFSRADAVVDVAYTGQTIAGAATDPESDPITYEKVGDGWLTVASDGTLGGTPTATGNYSFTVRATATGGTADATLNIAVVPAPTGVTELDAWDNIYSSSPNNTADTITAGSFEVGSGPQRLLLVSVVMETSSNSPIPVVSATYGGTSLTPINMATDTNKEVVWMGYLTDAQIGSGSKALTITYSNGSNNAIGLHVKWASYTGVNQTTPIVSSGAMHTRSNSVTFGSTINYVNNGMTIVVAGNNGTPASGALTATPAFTEVTTDDATKKTDGHTSMVFTTAKHTANGSYSSSTQVSWSSGGGHSGLVVVSLQP